MMLQAFPPQQWPNNSLTQKKKKNNADKLSNLIIFQILITYYQFIIIFLIKGYH
jgi:hypothetical protein